MDNLQTKSNPYIQQGYKIEPHMDGTNEIEEPVLVWDMSNFECKICHEKYTDEFSLKIHCDEHHQQELFQSVGGTKYQKETKCEQIDREQLQDENNLYVHQVEQYTVETIKIEETELSWGVSKYECCLCDGIFTDESSLEHHIDECHQHDLVEKPAQSIENEVESYLDQHVKSHKDERTYCCPEYGCSSLFKSQGKLNVHARVHSDKRPFKCELSECTKAFKSNWELKRHKKVHSGDKPYICQEFGCSKSYTSRSNLNQHILSHSDERPFKCEDIGCTKSFRSQHGLNLHLTVHSEEKPFICEYSGCNFSFKREKTLKQHMSLHSDMRPYKCEETGCTKSFRTRTSLCIHRTAHIDIKSFKCPQIGCSKSYKKKTHLVRHISAVHAGKT